MGVLRDLRGVVVADVRVQLRDEHQRVVQVHGDALQVGLYPLETVVVEGVDDVGEQTRRLQQVSADERHEDVELQMALHGAGGDGHVVADNLAADLRQRLALRRVHLAGHDGGTGLVGGQNHLAETAARRWRSSSAKPPSV